MRSGWKFLILTGHLRGRELKLPEGEFTIGSKDADLSAQLDDDKQVTLLVSEEEIRVKEESVPMWYEGEAQLAASSIPPSTIIDLAGFCFLLGAGDQELTLADVPERQKVIKSSGKNWLAIVCLSSCLVFAIGVAVFSWMNLNTPPVIKLDPKAWIEQQVQQTGYGNLELSWSDNGILTIGGYCRSVSKYQSLLGKLNGLGIHYKNQALCQEDIVHNVYFVLQQNGYSHVLVHSGKRLGTVVISGDISADKQWESVSQLIAQVNGLQSWKVRSEKDEGLSELVEKLREANLLDKLSLLRNNSTITITGHLSDEEESELSKVLSQYRRDDITKHRVIYQNIPISQSMLRLFPSAVRSFAGNAKNPYLILANGMRIQIGTRLPNGFEVSKLNTTSVELVKDGQVLHIPLAL
ncbi:type III secretion system inner membrane ring subunit SctD [Vibrio profundum]|uniref:type III secretion system inner membrane ring subunit SctD n=1 Tax=Vibrio profundum TaxID=2910247 RepID=UPI003D0F5C28